MEIRQACRDMQYDEAEVAREAQSILLNEERRKIYDRLHLQYIAIAHVEDRCENPSSVATENHGSRPEFSDTNHWSRRLVEFR